MLEYWPGVHQHSHSRSDKEDVDANVQQLAHRPGEWWFRIGPGSENNHKLSISVLKYDIVYLAVVLSYCDSGGARSCIYNHVPSQFEPFTFRQSQLVGISAIVYAVSTVVMWWR